MSDDDSDNSSFSSLLNEEKNLLYLNDSVMLSISPMNIIFEALDISFYLAQEIITFPLYAYYIESQVKPSERFEYSILYIVPIFYERFQFYGVYYFWKGLTSYLAIKAVTNFVDRNFDHLFIKNFFIGNFSRFIVRMFFRTIGNIFVFPFFTSMLIDCIMSEKSTGKRMPFFFILEAFNLVLGEKTSYSSNISSYFRPKKLTLVNRFIVYASYAAVRSIIYEVFVSICPYFIIKTKEEQSFVAYSESNSFSQEEDYDDEISASEVIEKSSSQNEWDTYSKKLTVHFFADFFSNFIVIPIFSTTIQCLLQGTEISLDPTYQISSNSIAKFSPIVTVATSFHHNLLDSFTNVYEEKGLLNGFFKGIGAFLIAYAIRYLLLKAIKKIIALTKSSKIKFE